MMKNTLLLALFGLTNAANLQLSADADTTGWAPDWAKERGEALEVPNKRICELKQGTWYVLYAKEPWCRCNDACKREWADKPAWFVESVEKKIAELA